MTMLIETSEGFIPLSMVLVIHPASDINHGTLKYTDGSQVRTAWHRCTRDELRSKYIDREITVINESKS